MSRDSGGASDSVYRRSQWTFQFATETGTLSSVGMAAMKGFSGLLRPFFAFLPGCLELSASFRALDGEEFFAIEGSFAQLIRGRLLT